MATTDVGVEGDEARGDKASPSVDLAVDGASIGSSHVTYLVIFDDDRSVSKDPMLFSVVSDDISTFDCSNQQPYLEQDVNLI